MLGEPFAKAAALSTQPGGNRGFTATTPLYLSIQGLFFTDNKPLQEELKLSEDQAKRLTELGEKSRARTVEIGTPGGNNEEREKLREQQAKDNEKALGEILKPEQLTRFKQLVLQYYATAPARFGASSVGRIVEVVEGLKLTKEQKDDLQQGKELAKVLDEKQQKLWKELL